MLVPATDLITAAKRHADASDPNAGAWLGTAVWQEWLDDVYRVLYDRLLMSGSVTPFPTDTTLAYSPATGYMTLNSSACRALVDVFRVVGSRYDLMASAQHTQQFPNLDLQVGVASVWGPWGTWGSAPGSPPLPLRSWAAFKTDDDKVRIQVSPRETADTYLIRTVSDPVTTGGYQMPPVAKRWVALHMARTALASEGVPSAATERLYGEASDDLESYLQTFQLSHVRKVSSVPVGGSAWGRPDMWWWRP